MAARKKAKVAKKKAPAKKSPARKRVAAKKPAQPAAAPKKKAAKAKAKPKATPPTKPTAAPAPLPAIAAKPAVVAARPAPPPGSVTAADVNLGHVAQLGTHAGFKLEAFQAAKRALEGEHWATIQEAARAVATRAVEISNENGGRNGFGDQ